MEQALMMHDYVDVVPLNEVYKNMKHIILLTPDVSVSQVSDDLSEDINELSQTLGKKMDRTFDIMTMRQDNLEKQMRVLMKGIQTNVVKNYRILSDMQSEQKKRADKEDAEKRKAEQAAQEEAPIEEEKE